MLVSERVKVRDLLRPGLSDCHHPPKTYPQKNVGFVNIMWNASKLGQQKGSKKLIMSFHIGRLGGSNHLESFSAVFSSECK